MRVAIIGRTEILYDTALRLIDEGHNLVCILTAKEAPEYTRGAEDFRALATQLGIEFISGVRINTYENILRRTNAEVAVSMNYPSILPQSIIDIFPYGVLNAHGGDLPRYRGNACQAWAILNGEERIGLCIHKMEGGELDSGDIIVRDFLKINCKTSVTEVWEWMSRRIPDLFSDALAALRQNPTFVLEHQSKDPSLALRCYPRRPEDGRINWTMEPQYVQKLINASGRPYSGAYCYLEGQKLIIWAAEIVEDDEIFCAVPGQILKVGGDFFDVASGHGKLRVLSFEVDGCVAPSMKFIKSIRTRLT